MIILMVVQIKYRQMFPLTTESITEIENQSIKNHDNKVETIFHFLKYEKKIPNKILVNYHL